MHEKKHWKENLLETREIKILHEPGGKRSSFYKWKKNKICLHRADNKKKTNKKQAALGRDDGWTHCGN